MHSKRWLLTSIIVVFSNDEQPLGDSLCRLWMYWTDKNGAFGMYGSPLTVIDIVYVWVSNIWTMPEIIGHTRLIINGLIGKPIINCYNQLLSINNNEGPAINFWRGCAGTCYSWCLYVHRHSFLIRLLSSPAELLCPSSQCLFGTILVALYLFDGVGLASFKIRANAFQLA